MIASSLDAVKYRCIIWEFRADYQAVTELKDKHVFVDQVIHLAGQQNPPGRFLECFTDGDINDPHKVGAKTHWRYYLASPRRIHDKITSTLRTKKLNNPHALLPNSEKEAMKRFLATESKLKPTVSKQMKKTATVSGLFIPGHAQNQRKSHGKLDADTTDTASESSSSGEEPDSPMTGLGLTVGGRHLPGGAAVSSLSATTELTLADADVICDMLCDDDDDEEEISHPGNIMFDQFAGSFAAVYWDEVRQFKSCRKHKIVIFERILNKYAAEGNTGRFVVLVRGTTPADKRCLPASADQVHTKIYSILCLHRTREPKIRSVDLKTLSRQPSDSTPFDTAHDECPSTSMTELDSNCDDADDAESLAEQPRPKKLKTGFRNAVAANSSRFDDEKSTARVDMLAVDDDYMPDETTYYEWSTFMTHVHGYLAARRTDNSTC